MKAAAEGEKMEWGTLYPNFAEVAEQEGFAEIANTFRMVAKVEAYHERRYLKLLENVKQGKVFKISRPDGSAETVVSFMKTTKPLIYALSVATQKATSKSGAKITKPIFLFKTPFL